MKVIEFCKEMFKILLIKMVMVFKLDMSVLFILIGRFF